VLATHEANLDSREITLEVKQKALQDARLTVTAHELAADVREVNLDTRAAKLLEREKRLSRRQLQELAAAQKRLEELQSSQVGEVRRVWDFLGQTEATLVPLGFSPLRSEVLTHEVGVVLPLLDTVDAKLSQLEEVTDGRLGEEGRALAEAVVEHMLLCFRSRDRQASLDPVV
jgi:hypothetical protein